MLIDLSAVTGSELWDWPTWSTPSGSPTGLAGESFPNWCTHTIALDFPLVSYDGGRTPGELHPETFSGERCPSVTLCHFHKHISVTSGICLWSVYVGSYVPLLSLCLPEFTSACSTSLFSGNMSCCSLTLVAQSQCGGTSSYNGLPLLWHCHWASTDGSAFPLLPLALGNAMTYNLHGCCSISLMGCLGNMVAHTPESSIRTEERVRASGMACSLLCFCLLRVPCLP